MSSPVSPSGVIRRAVQSDLPILIHIFCAAFLHDPTFKYRYPYMAQYPSDFPNYMQQKLGKILTSRNKHMLVYEVPSVEDPSVLRVVAMAVWQEPEPSEESDAAAPSSTPLPPRRDADPGRVAAYCAARLGDKTWREFFAQYDQNPGRLHLSTLACHPDYERRGAGTELLRWVLGKAGREGKVVTLLASSKGKGLYERCGFVETGQTRAQVEGEDEWVEQPAMVWMGDGKGRE